MKDIQHVTVAIAGSYVDLFQLPDGSRVGSLSSMAEAIGKKANSAFDFLKGNSVEASPYRGLTLSTVPKGRTRIKAVPLEVMTAYWSYQAEKGNIQAKSLIRAVTQEALERRLDGALGIHQTEAQYEEQTTQTRESLLKDALEAHEAYLKVYSVDPKEAWCKPKILFEHHLRYIPAEDRALLIDKQTQPVLYQKWVVDRADYIETGVKVTY
ncbi:MULTISPECIES: hypothetical protein [Cyanophyceae]|uniref:hypothetical protein n=1 Tax=Cyanophyceae TaxID=3028117 RepID=UPI0016856EAB|nr:hypothetical protein [Trichocoleus sp. FACHB-40]MBD2006880.1 hypothetical protein [Trichocoleus sp. FACHB-40]